MIALSEYLVDDVSNNQDVQEFAALLEQIRAIAAESSHGELNGLVSDMGFILPEQAVVVFEAFIDKLDVVWEKIDFQGILQVSDADEHVFWTNVIDYYRRRLETKQEVELISTLGEIDRSKMLEFVFENYFLYVDPFLDISSLPYSIEQISIARRIVSFGINHAINNLASQRAFTHQLMHYFQLNLKDADFLWTLIQANKTNLQFMSIRKDLTEFMDFWKDVFEEYSEGPDPGALQDSSDPVQ
jgi:hypothetical protein